MKNKIIAAIFIAVISMSGCSNSSETPQPTKTVYVNPNQSEPQVSISNDEDEFLSSVAMQMTPDLGPVPQGQVLEFGYVLCEGLEVLSVDQVLNATKQGVYNPKDVGTILASASLFLCPDQEQKVRSYIDQFGA